MTTRPNDAHIRSRQILIGDFDLTTAAAQTQTVGVVLPVGVLTVKLAYEIQGDGTNVSFEVSGKPNDATVYIEELDANTIATTTLVLQGTVDKWETWKVVYSAKVGTWTGTSTLKVWLIT